MLDYAWLYRAQPPKPPFGEGDAGPDFLDAHRGICWVP
jgi:hypothetical protein